MKMLRLPGESPLQRGLGALAVFAVFFMLLVAIASLGNRIASTGHVDLTPNPTPSAANHDTP